MNSRNWNVSGFEIPFFFLSLLANLPNCTVCNYGGKTCAWFRCSVAFLAFGKKILQAGKYAVFDHRGTLANLFKTYQYIFGTGLQTTKMELDDREDFEVYGRDVWSFDDPNNEVEIYIPVKWKETMLIIICSLAALHWPQKTVALFISWPPLVIHIKDKEPVNTR